MAQFRNRKRYTDADVVSEIEQLTADGHSASSIHGQIEHDQRFTGRYPSLRTVQNIVRDFTPPASSPWRLADADQADAALVLPVLSTIIEHTYGRVRQVTVDEARWIARIRRAAPDTPRWAAYLLARLYVAQEQRKMTDTDSLDLLLACAPWRPGGIERYQRLRADRWMPGIQVGPGFLKEIAEGDQTNG